MALLAPAPLAAAGMGVPNLFASLDTVAGVGHFALPSMPQWFAFPKQKQERDLSAAEGLCVGFSGAKGRGKSLLMSAMGQEYRQRGYRLWANYPCRGADTLDFAEFLKFPEWLRDGVILWDEFDRHVSSARGNMNVALYIDGFQRQIRKRKVFFLWGSQNPDALSSAATYQTDLLFMCDSPRHGPGKGKIIPVVIVDIAGEWGEPGSITQHVFRNMDHYWGCYDTDNIFDPLERWSVRLGAGTRGKVVRVNEGEGG